MSDNRQNEMVIENVMAADHDYVWLEQRTSYNGGIDFETTSQWKFNREEFSVQQGLEWISRPRVRVPLPDDEPAENEDRNA